MRRASATDILRDHARERWLRRAIRSVTLDGDRGGPPRMSEAAWVASCHLVRGVPGGLLDVLGLCECEASEGMWNWVAIDLPDARTLDLPTEQVARPMSLARAAALLGYALDYEAIRAMRFEALAIVTDNLLCREARNGAAA